MRKVNTLYHYGKVYRNNCECAIDCISNFNLGFTFMRPCEFSKIPIFQNLNGMKITYLD